MSDEDFTDDNAADSAVEGYENVAVKLPEFTKWSVKQMYKYNTDHVDYKTLEDLDKTLDAARDAMFLVTQKINEVEREEKTAKLQYDRAYRRAYLSSAEKTETARRARAELKCEELENEWVTKEQLKGELVRMSFTMKSELQTLQTIANNLRQQLRVM